MENDSRIDEIYDIVTFIKDNAVTKGEFGELKGEFGGLRGEFDELKQVVMKIQATMVTKDYLDEKLADLRGDLVVLTRKEDTKLKALIGLLKQKNVISEGDAKQLLTMEPFAELLL